MGPHFTFETWKRQQVGQFLEALNLPSDNIHLIGHSLGSHIASFAAKHLNDTLGARIARISGLDPAGPAFQFNMVEKLAKSDAKIVDVIHTDGGFFGHYYPLGTFDIYINGGTRTQPRCKHLAKPTNVAGVVEDSYCSHAYSHDVFAELINDRKFHCSKCLSLWKYRLDQCDKNVQYTFGVEDITEEMKGVCFVSTDVP